MIVRMADIVLVRTALRRSRVVALLGPRQCGKTTLAREFVAPDSLNYFDLEDPRSLARLTEPDTALRPLKKLVVIDEIPCCVFWPTADRSPRAFSFSAAPRQICSGSLRSRSPAVSRLFP